MKIISFEKAIELSEDIGQRHVLLGNGFSIACRPNIFMYKKLFEQADFSSLSPAIKEIFNALETQDFERVIRVLRDASAILKLYGKEVGGIVSALRSDAERLRELLVETIASSHPEWPGEISDSEYEACRRFLGNFKTVYTLNYDLLLYWVQMHTKPHEKVSSDDGFRKPEDNYDAAYVTWEPWKSYSQNTYYVHGALHIFDTGTEIQKYTWVNTNVRLIEQIREALNLNYFPLFVAEGSSPEKLARIRHSDFLSRSLKSLGSISGSLFIYGHSLATNDEHVLKRIERSKIAALFVGIYGDPRASENAAIINRALKMGQASPAAKSMAIYFYDSSTAQVWGK